VDPDSVAYAEGLRPSDVILQINDTPVSDWYGILSEDLLTKDAGTFRLTVLSGSVTNVMSLPSESSLSDMEPAMLPLLATVDAKEAAGQAGLKTGDLVTDVGGTPIRWWHELAAALQDFDGKQTTITVLRDEKTVTLDITPAYNEELEKVIIGVTPGDPGMLAWTMEGDVFQQLKSDGSKIFRLLKALTNRNESASAAKALGGPITIFAMIWFALKLGIFYAIGLIRFININLAVLNLLPLPVLDGGHICFALWEGITRRKVHPRVVATLVNVFAILLLSAMVFLSWRDTDRIWNISRFFKKAPVEQAEAPPSE
jgi:regulator of sigma E protease